MKTKQKKKFKLNAVKIFIQVAAFIFIPGLFITVFSAIRDIYTSIIGGSFSITGLAEPLILTVSVLMISAAIGRFFCGFLCSFGAMGDLLWFIGRKLKIPRIKISEKNDRIFKMLKYILLVSIVVCIWTLGLFTVNSTSNPWTIFGMYASVKGWPAIQNLFSIGGLLLLMILIGSLFIERFFCRYLCPLGAIFTLISRNRLFHIKKPSCQCGSCQVCTKRCPMGIPLYQSDTVTSGECIDCFSCIDICPRNNITANPKPAMVAVIAVTSLIGLYYTGDLVGSIVPSETGTVSHSLNMEESKGQYTDGVYTGSASGYRGTTKVQVTVENGYITAIDILSTGDDEEFFDRVKNTVISNIIASQNTNVDVISGATFSSNGIMNAVADALSGGDTNSGQETGYDAQSDSGSDQEMTSDSQTNSGNMDLTDGIYTGSGTGFRGTTTVSVTVSQGIISDITVESYEDDEPYFENAEDTVIDEILGQQSVTVDAVSGATFSSNGIMEAVSNALGQEYDNPNSSIQNERPGGQKRQRY